MQCSSTFALKQNEEEEEAEAAIHYKLLWRKLHIEHSTLISVVCTIDWLIHFAEIHLIGHIWNITFCITLNLCINFFVFFKSDEQSE